MSGKQRPKRSHAPHRHTQRHDRKVPLTMDHPKNRTVRPGATQCRRCRSVETYDKLTPASDVPGGGKRGFYCDECVPVMERLYGAKAR